ncbi:MAG: tetratricopeptide repeat protein [Planctomycetota bacterium]
MITCSNCGQTAEEHVRFCPQCGTQMLGDQVSKDSILGRTLNGKYRVLSELGAGAMGRVYLAEHVSLKKRVAIKVLHSDLDVSEESLQRFHREGIAAGKFSHPNAIQIFDFDRDGERTVYLAMEFVEGETLKAFVAREGTQDPESAVRLIRQVLSALEAAHGAGIVHRDLKPENVMVVTEPSGRRNVKVLDFGLSKLVDMPMQASLQTQTGRILGTPQYMAPEQCGSGEVDIRTDLHAAGLLLYELIAGEPAYQGSNLTEVLIKLTTEDAPVLVEAHPELAIPEDLSEVLEKALEKKQVNRFQSATEMIEALDAIRFDVMPKKGKKRRSAKARASSSPNRMVPIAILSVLVLAALVWGGISLLGSGPEEETADSSSASKSVRVRLRPEEERSEVERQYLGLLESAQRSLRTDDLRTALREVGEAIRQPCVDAEAYETRAQIFRRQGDIQLALADFEEARRLDPDSVRSLTGAGWILLESNSVAEALERFEKAVEEDPQSAEGWAGQGAVHFLTAEWSEAESCLQKALAIDENNFAAHTYLGRLRLDQGRDAEAIEPLQKAVRLDAARAEPYGLLGRALLREDKFEDAERQLEIAHDLRPGSVEVATDLATVYLAGGRLDRVVDLLDNGFDVRSEPRLAGLLGTALAGQGESRRAIVHLSRAVELDPEDTAARRVLVACFLDSGEPREALTQIESLRPLVGPDSAVELDEALCWMELGAFDKAGEAARKSVELDSDNLQAKLIYGLLLLDYLAQPDAAAAQFQQYVSAGGRDPRVREWLQTLGR